MRSVLGLLLLLTVSSGYSATVYDTLYLNKGTMTTADASSFAYLAFNNSDVFDQENHRITLSIGDSLYLRVINTDSEVHGFDITNTTGYSATIPAGDSATIACKFDELGIYIFHDNYNYPNNRYMGAAGMICVDDFADSKFYWNLKEHTESWNDSLNNGWTVNWMDYYPDQFSINGKNTPDINADVDARITGSVGETMRLYVANSGQSAHSLHFHGYHLEVIYSSKSSLQVGRSKDTFGVESMESMILELIPDKPGEYPVHDHNLVAVSASGIYPGGMFMTMLIE